MCLLVFTLLFVFAHGFDRSFSISNWVEQSFSCQTIFYLRETQCQAATLEQMVTMVHSQEIFRLLQYLNQEYWPWDLTDISQTQHDSTWRLQVTKIPQDSDTLTFLFASCLRNCGTYQHYSSHLKASQLCKLTIVFSYFEQN